MIEFKNKYIFICLVFGFIIAKSCTISDEDKSPIEVNVISCSNQSIALGGKEYFGGATLLRFIIEIENQSNGPITLVDRKSFLLMVQGDFEPVFGHFEGFDEEVIDSKARDTTECFLRIPNVLREDEYSRIGNSAFIAIIQYVNPETRFPQRIIFSDLVPKTVFHFNTLPEEVIDSLNLGGN